MIRAPVTEPSADAVQGSKVGPALKELLARYRAKTLPESTEEVVVENELAGWDQQLVDRIGKLASRVVFSSERIKTLRIKVHLKNVEAIARESGVKRISLKG